MALASNYLGAVLSSESLLRATVFQAFWNPRPVYPYDLTQDPTFSMKLPRYDLLTRSNNLRELTLEEQDRMQQLILAQSWCTPSRLRDYCSTLCSAALQDLLQEMNLTFTPEKQNLLKRLVLNPPGRARQFEVTSVECTNITISQTAHYRTRCKCTSIVYSGAGPRSRNFDLLFHPIHVTVVPDFCVRGNPWTSPKLQRLQILVSQFNRPFQPVSSCDRFIRGMEDAIVQRNNTALLVLAWAAGRLFGIRCPRGFTQQRRHYDLPQDIFRLVLRDLPEDDESADAVAISMFKILIRVSAESMPRHDEGITTWATRLLSRPRDRGFGRWLIDFDKRPLEPDPVRSRESEGKCYVLFHCGEIGFMKVLREMRPLAWRWLRLKDHSDFDSDIADMMHKNQI